MTVSPRIAICITTFHRPEGLRRLLHSIAALELPDPAPEVSVVVVNNDPDDPRPAAICVETASRLPFGITCIAEEERGLAAPRNRALAHAERDHDFIAFIDDDSIATPDWLANLLAVQVRTDADVVTGPVAPTYAEPPPDWLERGGFFSRHGAPSGSRLSRAFTNNVLIRTDVLVRTGIRFDTRFGLIGGEDVHFFRRLHAGGATIVWADDAVVEDIVPEERMTEQWLVRRHRRTGMTTALIERDLGVPALVVPLVAAKAAIWMLLGGGTLLAGSVAGRATRVRARCWLGWGHGLAKGLAGETYAEYLEER
jgi:GT2 family glycosyltransferase